MKESIIKEKSYLFALRIIGLARWLRGQREYEMGGQVLRAGTSIGANVEEALAGVSRRDFVAKMAVASKEARETNYWLRLLRAIRTLFQPPGCRPCSTNRSSWSGFSPP